MTISFGDDIRAAVSMVYRGADTFMNVYHYAASVGVNATEAAVIAAIGAHLVTAYGELTSQITDELEGSEIEFYKRDTGTGNWNGIGSYDFSGWAGGSAGDEIPSGVAAVVRFFADGTGYQGRKFIGPILDGSIVGGVLGAGLIAALTAYAADIVADVAVTGGDMEPAWWSEADLIEYELNGTVIVNTVPGYQRRRKQGIGI